MEKFTDEDLKKLSSIAAAFSDASRRKALDALDTVVAEPLCTHLAEAEKLLRAIYDAHGTLSDAWQHGGVEVKCNEIQAAAERVKRMQEAFGCLVPQDAAPPATGKTAAKK